MSHPRIWDEVILLQFSRRETSWKWGGLTLPFESVIHLELLVDPRLTIKIGLLTCQILRKWLGWWAGRTSCRWVISAFRAVLCRSINSILPNRNHKTHHLVFKKTAWITKIGTMTWFFDQYYQDGPDIARHRQLLPSHKYARHSVTKINLGYTHPSFSSIHLQLQLAPSEIPSCSQTQPSSGIRRSPKSEYVARPFSLYSADSFYLWQHGLMRMTWVRTIMVMVFILMLC